MGIFDNEIVAVEACRNKYYFLGPVELNRLLPDKLVPWPGCRYPL